ncbi:MAG: restriction endonuclease subunit S [Veillonella sp.]|uniref:restriction endonuclease subunit S n=1 Tax=Veillonella sp. TaxID=1926307 RepID=UPI001D3F788F|nr:restriction endonuclease subunit S [Veillonella sp.]MBS6391295.1 restriction endonuclease subunit S [Veillonella sp.]
MNKEKRRVPKLRFPGFTEDWEQRKLGEIVNSYSGGTPTASNKEYYGGDIPFIRSAEINSDSTELYITQKGLDNSSAKIVEKGTILYAMYGATSGEVGISKINGAINQAILAMIPLEYNGKIIAQYLRKNKESITGKYLQGGQGNLSANIILELPIQLPGLEESNQIANFLESFDNIITLHQRKLEHLNLKKKALLQKLFPKNGARYPELRFPGFTDAWEQRKLSDITDVIMGQSPSSKNYTDNPNDNILVQGNADLKDGKVIPRLWTKEITKTINKDGIILTVRAPVGDVAKTDYKVVLGRGVAGIKGNDFIYQFLQKLQYNRHWVSLSSGSTFESINSNDIKDLIIDIPSIEEQNKISMLLNNVNSIITLHQRKLEHLQLQKKALLQQMFV